ncbi:hypothetical protein [Streptacidiphilus cavernicola]|uniref:Uncharacterized protein n=1 Tax=Streptacidiphilus cavernicola TaxID=3342716 RepID=A0ABV6W4Z5_9ACTN
MKRTWRAIYAAALTVTTAGLGATADCVLTSRPDGAIGSLALFIAGVVAFRMAWEIDILNRRRVSLTTQERLFEAERGVYERDIDRARHDLAAEEHALRKQRSADRAALCEQLAEERDKMQVEFDAKKTEIKKAAFKMGWQMRENGVATEHRNADVIVLPVGTNAPTIMGTGTSHQ